MDLKCLHRHSYCDLFQTDFHVVCEILHFVVHKFVGVNNWLIISKKHIEICCYKILKTFKEYLF